MDKYLESSCYIDWQTPGVLAQAKTLSEGLSDKVDIARACFIFVRDQIKHSWDYKQNPVTCKASEVLEHGTGYCYAKSHLLAALLRANNIPAALCYQRLCVDDEQPPFCLHGLNSIYLEDVGWYRVDARGNKTDIDAQFCPPKEKLAFSATIEGEIDSPNIYSEPLAVVIDALENYSDYRVLADNLPDSKEF